MEALTGPQDEAHYEALKLAQSALVVSNSKVFHGGDKWSEQLGPLKFFQVFLVIQGYSRYKDHQGS